MGAQLWIAPLQLVEGTAGNGHYAQRMGKTRTFGPVKGKAGWPQLPNPPQPLEGWRINQPN
jgi:hypothetical protein